MVLISSMQTYTLNIYVVLKMAANNNQNLLHMYTHIYTTGQNNKYTLMRFLKRLV